MVYWGGGTNSNSIAVSRVHNKLFYQLSTFCKAFAEFMNGKGYNCTDNDIQVLKNSFDLLYKDNTNVYRGNNGFIYFGDRYDRVCLQWYSNQVATIADTQFDIILPISFSEPYCAIVSQVNTEGVPNNASTGIEIFGFKNGQTVGIDNTNNINDTYLINLIAIGRV